MSTLLIMSRSLQMVGMRRNGYHDDGLNNSKENCPAECCAQCKKDWKNWVGGCCPIILIAIAITFAVLFSLDKKMIDGTIYEHQIVQYNETNPIIYDGNIHIIYEFKSHDNTRWETVYTDTNRSEVINVLNTNYTIGNDYEVKKFVPNAFWTGLTASMCVFAIGIWFYMVKDYVPQHNTYDLDLV